MPIDMQVSRLRAEVAWKVCRAAACRPLVAVQAWPNRAINAVGLARTFMRNTDVQVTPGARPTLSEVQVRHGSTEVARETEMTRVRRAHRRSIRPKPTPPKALSSSPDPTRRLTNWSSSGRGCVSPSCV